jgi:hypothetical protein
MVQILLATSRGSKVVTIVTSYRRDDLLAGKDLTKSIFKFQHFRHLWNLLVHEVNILPCSRRLFSMTRVMGGPDSLRK